MAEPAPSPARSQEKLSEPLDDHKSSESDVAQPDEAPHGEADAEKGGAKPAPANPWADPSSFPDGGAPAWLTVAGAAACLFVSFGWINCVGIFQAYYESNLLRGDSSSKIAWVASLQVFFMLFGGPFVGSVFDNYGPRHLLIFGTFFHVFGLMMLSISTEYYQILLSQAVCSPIGASCVFYPAFNCVATWFFQKRGMAIGMVAAGSSLGGVIFPIMISHLIPEVGFGWTIRICAFIILALLIVANLSVRSRIPPTKRPFSLMAYVHPFKEPPFSMLTAASFFYYWGMFLPFTFIILEAESKGMSTYLAFYLVPILNAASIFGRTVPNIIADKVGRFNVMIVTGLLNTIFILALWIPASSNAPLIVFAAFYGISSGAGIGLLPALVAQISPIKDIGLRTGAVYIFASVAALTGSPIGGQIITVSGGSFRNCQIYAGAACALGTGLFIVTRIMLAGVKMVKV